MLTPEEAEALNQLIDARRAPQDGMERHFLRVISGDATPCSPKELDWYQHWQQVRSPAPNDHSLNYDTAATLLHEREETIRTLKEHIAALESELKRLGSVLLQKDQSISTLTKENLQLAGWLKNAHEALNKSALSRNIQEPVEETYESDILSTCQACGRPVDFCSCSN